MVKCYISLHFKGQYINGFRFVVAITKKLASRSSFLKRKITQHFFGAGLNLKAVNFRRGKVCK